MPEAVPTSPSVPRPDARSCLDGVRRRSHVGRDEGITDLIDRLEARIGLLMQIARDNQLGAQLVDVAGGLAQLADPTALGSLFEEARQLVRDGRLRYRGVVARAVDRGARRGDHAAMRAA